MAEIDAAQALERYGLTDDAHAAVLESASQGRPWTPEIVSQPGVKIEEGIYVENILGSDPREPHDRHSLLIDGRLDRYASNIGGGRNKWDLVLTERDFHTAPEDVAEPEHSTVMGDADLLFLDLDRYEAHMVEVKPHEGYADSGSDSGYHNPDPDQWQHRDEEYPDEASLFIEESEADDSQLLDAEPERRSFEQSNVQNTSDNRNGGTKAKKASNWKEAWKSVIGELDEEWAVYEPEFIFGSKVLDKNRLASNPEYALPPKYSQQPGYVMGTEEGLRKAEEEDDLEVLDEFFFRGGISRLIDGERPEIEKETVF